MKIKLKVLLIGFIIFCIFKMIVMATAIDIGSPAIDRASALAGGKTYILVDNPADYTGKITSLELYVNSTPITTPIIAIFTQVDTNVFTARDHVHLATVPGGEKITRTIDIDSNPISLNVVAGDVIGFYHVASGNVEADTSGSGMWEITGNQTECNEETFTFTDDRTISIYGTGETVAAGVTWNTATISKWNNIEITKWNGI